MSQGELGIVSEALKSVGEEGAALHLRGRDQRVVGTVKGREGTGSGLEGLTLGQVPSPMEAGMGASRQHDHLCTWKPFCEPRMDRKDRDRGSDY